MWWYVPITLCILWVFVMGMVVGSFLNVLIARMPFEKSIFWPGSRCFACLRPIRKLDNLPLLGYLLLRGRCRYCHTPFSSRYLWVEVATGIGFVTIFTLTVLMDWHGLPGARNRLDFSHGGLPSLTQWIYFSGLAILFSLLLAASVIDLQYRIIPTQLTLSGTVIGLLYSTLLPWPWPHDPSRSPGVFPNTEAWGWTHPSYIGQIPTGLTLWPFCGPLEAWAPAGSMTLGLVNGLLGAATGMFVGRAVKFLFEVGFGKEALGLGDADLLMMAGAFLGWQITVIALPAGAMILLPIVVPIKLWMWARGSLSRTSTSNDPADDPSAVPFGPGIAAGIVSCWLLWPWLGELLRTVFFDSFMLGMMALILGGGLLVCGLILRRGNG